VVRHHLPLGEARDGALLWSCGDDPSRHVAGIRLRDEGAEGAVRRAAWSVNGQAPDTVTLRGTPGSRMWLVDDAQVDDFTRRVRTTERLGMRVLDGPGGEEEYQHTLPCADSALASLECVKDAAVPGMPSGRATLLALSKEPFLRPDGKLENDPLPEGWMPRLVNLPEVYRRLQAAYPPTLRDMGITGDVHVRMRVLRDGQVDLPTARATYADHPMFIPAAMTALPVMRFHPARRNGELADVWVTLPIMFALPH